MNQIIDIYCERMDAGFWAEPVNAVTNAAFLVAAFVLARRLRGSDDRAAWFLTALVAAIGIGSFLFHTFATGWAAIADVAPIALFMLSAVAIGLKRRFDLPVQAAALGTIVFVFAVFMLNFTRLITVIPAGSVSYLPAALTLFLFAGFLARRKDPFARFFLLAAPVFALSLTLRSVDMAVCGGFPVGTHFFWHLLNAVTLYLVTRGLMKQPT